MLLREVRPAFPCRNTAIRLEYLGKRFHIHELLVVGDSTDEDPSFTEVLGYIV